MLFFGSSLTSELDTDSLADGKRTRRCEFTCVLNLCVRGAAFLLVVVLAPLNFRASVGSVLFSVLKSSAPNTTNPFMISTTSGSNFTSRSSKTNALPSFISFTLLQS